MTLETPFRLMWTDEEGDNVCFSTDEELAQAAREARARNNPQADFGAATFARGAAEFGEGMNQMASHFCRQFGGKPNAFEQAKANTFANNWNTNEKKADKMAHKMGKKCEKMKAKQQFHEEKARMLDEMIKNINPN